MKINDQQFGRPQILYKATKAQIEATPNPQDGMIAFATDTNQIGIYTSGGWQWGTGGGDMLKAIYDTDNDGVVDAAESVDWSGVQNKPSTYPPSSHNHDDRYYTEDELNTSGGGGQVHWNNVTNKPSSYPPSSHQHAASDVTSGVFDPARIPNLDASKITSGTLSTDRFSAYNDLVAESKIGLVTGRLPTADQARGAGGWYSVVQDWTSTTLPSEWSWAGSPFVTPPSTATRNGTIFYATGYTTASRSFLFRSLPSGWSFVAGLVLHGNTNGFVGLRLDDGSDNNYVEVVLRSQGTDRQTSITLRYRTGGGTVTEVTPSNYIGAWLKMTNTAVILNTTGTQWSNWGFQAILQFPYGGVWMNGSIVSGMTWTPTRAGVVIQASGANWEQFGVDWTNF